MTSICRSVKRIAVPVFLILFAACSGGGLQEEKANKTTEFKSNDTIPDLRRDINPKPIASYIIPIKDPKLNFTFGVNIFETRKTFDYLLDMHYEGMVVKDTLKIPNFGTWPIVQVKPGDDKLSCIIGFLDKEKNFKEYKMLTAKEDKLRLKVLHRYAVGRYRTEY